VSFRLFFEGIPIKLRAELHTEYFTLSLTAELDTEEELVDGIFNNETREAIEVAFGTLSGIVQARCREQGEARTREEESDCFREHIRKARRPCRYLVDQFWSEVDQRLISPSLTPTFNGPLSGEWARTDPHPSLRDQLGQYITDCRGLVLAVDSCEDLSGKCWTLVPPFTPRKRKSLRDYVGLDHFFDKSNAIDVFGALEPIVHAARRASAASTSRKDPFHGRPDRRVFEYAVSRVQRNRAIYITALGPQPLWSDYHEPLCYLVITRHRHRWQIGRFLDRMNVLGTLRVASLMEYPSLNRAGFLLREIIQKLDRLGSIARGADALRNQAEDEEFRKVQASVPGGGLLYRTERALFYVRNFRAEYKAMKFGRV
jgi:hypothetical protein